MLIVCEKKKVNSNFAHCKTALLLECDSNI